MAMPQYSSRAGARSPARRDKSAVNSGDSVNIIAVGPLPRCAMAANTSRLGSAYDTSAVMTK